MAPASHACEPSRPGAGRFLFRSRVAILFGMGSAFGLALAPGNHVVAAATAASGSSSASMAASAPRKRFDLPADAADKALKRFSEQSGLEVVFPSEVARGIRTQAVNGTMTAREALDRLLARTGLTARQDPTMGAFTIVRAASSPNPEPVPAPNAKAARAKPTRAAAPTPRPARQPQPPSAAAEKEETIEMPVFEVSSARDVGYAATSAMSGTRTNELLANLPNAITVLNADFLADVGVNDLFDAVEFAAGAENTFNDSGTRGATIGTRAGTQINFRGLPTFRQLRDGFPVYVPQDAYNTERIEISRGPGGLAYGDVDAGGVINVTTKRANHRRRASAQFRFDDFGTRRSSADVSQPIVPNRVSVRLNAIESDIETHRQRAGNHLHGLAGALRWDPFDHGRTRVDLTVERGNQKQLLSHGPLNDHTAVYAPGTGTNQVDANPALAGNQINGIGMRRIAPAGNLHAFTLIEGTLYNLQTLNNTTGPVFRNSIVIETPPAVSPNDPQNPNRIPILPISENVIPFGQDWGGSENFASADWDAALIEVQHRVSDKLSVLLAQNFQRDDALRQTIVNGAAFGNNARTIFIDVNRVLPDSAGPPGATIPNPNFEKRYIAQVPVRNDDAHEISATRAVLAWDADFPFGIEQRFVLSGGYRHETYERNQFSFALTDEEIAARGFEGAAADFGNNLLTPVIYLEGGNSDERLRLPTDPGGFFRQGVNNLRFDQSLTSVVLSAIGSCFDGRLRSSFGVSRDYWNQKSSLPIENDPARNNRASFVRPDGSFVLADEEIPLPRTTENWITNFTAGLVYHATPLVSFTGAYQQSSLFTDNVGIDLYGAKRDPTRGEGFDYGVRFHLLDNRVQVSATYFDNDGENIAQNVTGPVVNELNALLGAGTVPGQVDSRTRRTAGYELEVTANPTRRWTARIAVGTARVTNENRFPQLALRYGEAREAAVARGLDPDAATVLTQEALFDDDVDSGKPSRIAGSLTTRYLVDRGFARGLAFGVTLRYASGRFRPPLAIGGETVLPATTTEHEFTISPFVSYRRAFGRVSWVAQVNANNVFDRVTDQGTVYRYPRYTSPRQWVFTNTLIW